MKKPERFKHQADYLDHHAELREWALFWEQGTAKTRPILENVAKLWQERKVDTLFVLAPTGVHRNWVEDEIPLWLDVPYRAIFWESSKTGTQKFQRSAKQVLHAKELAVVTMGYDAIMTQKGHNYIKSLCTKRNGVFYVLDESTAIKTPKAKRTIRVVASGRWAQYRRILTGTPITNSPFDVYKPVQFLDPDFWKRYEFPDYATFKTYFGIWTKGTVKTPSGDIREYPSCSGYQHLDELHAMLQEISTRVVKDETLDLPPKLYSKRNFEMTKEQKRVYREIRDAAMTFLSSGDLVTVPHALVRLLRLHQVTSNYLPTDGVEPVVDIDKRNPRLECLEAYIKEAAHQTIIWARFNRDVDLIMDLLGKDAVRADGKVNSDGRARAKRAFQAGDVQCFVSKPSVTGVSRGLTLTAAKSVIYYNNSFSLEDRLQSEDRAHRAGLKHPVGYVDIVAPGTVDVRIVRALRDKDNIAATITGDKLKEWI